MIDLLDDHISAVRDVVAEDDHGAGVATRLRLRRSLECDHGVQRRLASIGVALIVLLAASASWALATGQLQKLWHRAERVQHHEWIAPEVTRAVEPRAAPPIVHRAPVHEPVRVTIEAPQPAVTRGHHERIAEVAPVPPAPVPHVETSRFEIANELHFHGNDYAAALGAWDAYLAAEPHGAFVVEARWNRALCLVRLGRLAEARTALAPFAEGEVEADYRQDEAKTLLARIADSIGAPADDSDNEDRDED